jgi:hypothetical protein
MRAHQDQQVITLFDGERIAPGYRGRRSNLQIATRVRTRIAIALAAALIGFATAATAITVRQSNQSERFISAGANPGGVPGMVGFEAALY